MPTMRKGSPMVYPGIIFQCHSYAYAAMLLQYGVSLLRRMMRLAPPSPPPWRLEAGGHSSRARRIAHSPRSSRARVTCLIGAFSVWLLLYNWG